jgi:hypothetical protein
VENANLLDDQSRELFSRRKLLDFPAGDDDHSNSECGHFNTYEEVGPREMLRLAGDPVCRDQDPETHSAMPNFCQKPGDLFTGDRVVPSLAFDEKETVQASEPSWIVIVFAGDVDLFRRKRVHRVAGRDPDAGNALQEVTSQILERLAFR